MSLDLSNEAITNCPNTAKAWIMFDSKLNTIDADFNVVSITDNGTGTFNVNLNVNVPLFSAVVGTTQDEIVSGSANRIFTGGMTATNIIDCTISRADNATLIDTGYCAIIAFGDQ